MPENRSESEALPERVMPQWSLRFLMSLIVLSAVVMWVFRAAIRDDVFWAQCVAVVLVTAAGCFALYALTFAMASLFASLTGAILQPTHLQGQQVGDDDRVPVVAAVVTPVAKDLS